MSASYCFALHGRCIAPRVRDSIFAGINAPRWRRSWNVWLSCSQDGPQGSQHLIRFSVGHFALAQGNPWGDLSDNPANPELDASTRCRLWVAEETARID